MFLVFHLARALEPNLSRNNAETSHEDRTEDEKCWQLQCYVTSWGSLYLVFLDVSFSRFLWPVLGCTTSCHYLGSAKTWSILKPEPQLCDSNWGFYFFNLVFLGRYLLRNVSDTYIVLIVFKFSKSTWHIDALFISTFIKLFADEKNIDSSYKFTFPRKNRSLRHAITTPVMFFFLSQVDFSVESIFKAHGNPHCSPKSHTLERVVHSCLLWMNSIFS